MPDGQKSMPRIGFSQSEVEARCPSAPLRFAMPHGVGQQPGQLYNGPGRSRPACLISDPQSTMEHQQTPDDNSSSDEGTLIETPPEETMSYDGPQLQADVTFNSQTSASQQYGNNFGWNGGGGMGNSWMAGPGPSMSTDSLYPMGGMPTSFGGSGVADFTHSPLMSGMQLLQPPALHHFSDAHPYPASANPGQMAADPGYLDPHTQGDPASPAENPFCSYHMFKKLADLKRHHGSVHKSWESNMYCPHWNCKRGTNSKNPFTRKDKLRSHLDHKHAGQPPPSNDADFF